MKDELDFLVIGAQKAGTTSLFEYLRYHPEIWLPANKEAPFFSHDTKWEQGWDAYLRNEFASADSICKWGTVTPSYMVGGIYQAVQNVTSNEDIVPRRIREYLPDVRLVAILRDPVERAQSHYKMMVMNGLEQRPFSEAIDDLLNPESLERSRKHPEEITGYVTWGEYGRILGGYFNTFSHEQILILFTDELKNTPAQVLRHVYEFLEVAPDFLPANLGTRYREGSTARRFSWLSPHVVQESLTQMSLARTLWHALPEAGQRWIDRRYESVNYRLDLWNRRRDAQIDIPPATLTRLREHFAPDGDELVQLAGVTPPWLKPAGVS